MGKSEGTPPYKDPPHKGFWGQTAWGQSRKGGGVGSRGRRGMFFVIQFLSTLSWLIKACVRMCLRGLGIGFSIGM